MAKLSQPVLLLLATALCYLSILVPCEGFVAEGIVYCDLCRAGFVTKGASYVEGAKVKLQCKSSAGKITFEVDGKTNKHGVYEIEVDDVHEQEECEVMLIESPKPECNEIDPERKGPVLNLRRKQSRLVNALGFLVKEPIPDYCPGVLASMGLADLPSSKCIKK